MATLCEQTAAFREQLEVWARGLQADCEALKRVVDHSAAPEGHFAGRELVRSMEADVGNLGASVRQIRDDAFGDGTLSAMLAAALQFQSDSEVQLERVEQYLQHQHGYVLVEREPMDASPDAAVVAASTAAAPAPDEDVQAALPTSPEKEEHQEEEEQEEAETEHEETCSDEDADPLAAADALMSDDSPVPSLESFHPASPECTSQNPDMPRTPRLEDFGLEDLATKYGLAMDDEAGPHDPAGGDGEDAQSEKLGAATQSLSAASKPATVSDLPVGTAQTLAEFKPRQSPRLAARLESGWAHQSPMEKVLARALSPSPLKALNRADSHGLPDLKARLRAATQGATRQQKES